jgi:hypothetical protein
VNLVPILILAAVWLIVLLILRPRQRNRFQREIDELDAAMK